MNKDKLNQSSMEEKDIVDRAKAVLIKHLSMTEQQAHRFIEKQAMDMRVNKTAVAEGILKTYES
ncbi:MAG TPA: ANTAR domain-containing protein [Clostridiales bacterium]|jgi:AmiR/NasT family two-component response regulator|nr:ANTAR domain-containing protein [Clostridiales bacterium]